MDSSTNNQVCQFWSECIAIVARVCAIFPIGNQISSDDPVKFHQIVRDALGFQYSSEAIDCVVWRKYFEIGMTWNKSRYWRTMELRFWVDEWSIQHELPENCRRMVIETGLIQPAYCKLSIIYKLISPIFRVDFFTSSPPPLNHGYWVTNDFTLEVLLRFLKPSDNPNWLLPYLRTDSCAVFEVFPELEFIPDNLPKGAQLEYDGAITHSLWNGPVLSYFWDKEKELSLVSYLSWALGLPMLVSIKVARTEKPPLKID